MKRRPLSVLAAAAVAAEKGVEKLLYVTVPDGAGGTKGHGILIFDIENGYKLVRQIDIPDIGGTHGVCANAETNRLFYSHSRAKLACMDLVTEKKLWEVTYNKSEGGSTRFNKLLVIDTKTDTIIRKVGPFAGVIWPFTVNGKGTICYVNTGHIVGFEVGDLRTGKKLHQVLVKGMEKQRRRCHGIGLTPDESEIWLVDQDRKQLHVFDATVMPPVEKQTIDTSAKSHGWITFSLDARHAYPDTGDIIDIKTKKIIATLKDAGKWRSDASPAQPRHAEEVPTRKEITGCLSPA